MDNRKNSNVFHFTYFFTDESFKLSFFQSEQPQFVC